MQRGEEIERFKSEINLSAYAATEGFMLDRKKSSRNSAIMRSSTGDKIIVARFPNQHWVYFSVHDDFDKGTIIDFVQNRKGGSIGEVRRTLRPWLQGKGLDAIDIASYVSELEPITRDLASVRARYEAMMSISEAPAYLKTRCLPEKLVLHPRFSDRIRIDQHKNVIFPHFNLLGLCGYEVKNQNFTGFAPGAEKGLWGSHLDASDSQLVICETAIDALSYAALHEIERTRFISTAGALNPAQPELLARAMKKLPEGGKIVLALDNDEGGDQLLAQMQAIFDEAKPIGSTLKIDRPKNRGEDWNDVLQSSNTGADSSGL